MVWRLAQLWRAGRGALLGVAGLGSAPLALLGTLIGFSLCFYSYWMNSYWGGAVAGIGGALMAGAWPRIARGRNVRPAAWAFGAGGVILLLTRPYEGLLLAAPLTISLWLRNRAARVWIPVAALLLAGLGWTAFYDYRVTGDPFRMPYQEYSAQYESVPPLIVLPVRKSKPVRHFDQQFLNENWTREKNDAREKRRARKTPLRAAGACLSRARRTSPIPRERSLAIPSGCWSCCCSRRPGPLLNAPGFWLC